MKKGKPAFYVEMLISKFKELLTRAVSIESERKVSMTKTVACNIPDSQLI